MVGRHWVSRHSVWFVFVFFWTTMSFMLYWGLFPLVREKTETFRFKLLKWKNKKWDKMKINGVHSDERCGIFSVSGHYLWQKLIPRMIPIGLWFFIKHWALKSILHDQNMLWSRLSGWEGTHLLLGLKTQRSRRVGLRSLIYPKCLAQCPTHSRYSIGICEGFLIPSEMFTQLVPVNIW